MNEANRELINIARKTDPSVLRNGTYAGLSQPNWMTEVVNELSTRCPTVAKILSSLLDCPVLDAGNKLPQISLIYGIILKSVDKSPGDYLPAPLINSLSLIHT